jgi:hypothetical protein
MQGPAIFLAQFVGDAPPFNSFDAICGWAAGLGYKGVQLPTADPRLIDLDKAAASQTYCDEITGVAASHGVVITELSTHLQGQLVAVHPAYDEAFDAFAPPAVKGRPKERHHGAPHRILGRSRGNLSDYRGRCCRGRDGGRRFALERGWWGLDNGGAVTRKLLGSSSKPSPAAAIFATASSQ